MEEDRSALFNQLKNFSQRKLKKVETKVVTGTGEQLVEKRGAKGLQVLNADGAGAGGQTGETEANRKLDLQVGFVLPGLLLGSQDVAHDKSTLDSYGVTHVLNLASQEVASKFEDDYNYKSVEMRDEPQFELERVLDDCFDFIDDGRHYGNVLVHCAGFKGLSRSTALCVAYLMQKEKQKFEEALANVKEARSFVRPNEGFVGQLKEYQTKLMGVQAQKESGIDDPFALRKKQEIEQEKAMVAGAASVKNRMKMFGATLDTGSAPRSKSVSPAPPKWSSPDSSAKTTSNTNISINNNNNTPTSSAKPTTATSKTQPIKSITPEPKKTWSSSSATSARANSGPPAPPPPPPAGSLLDKSKQPGGKAPAPPPPPPPGLCSADKPAKQATPISRKWPAAEQPPVESKSTPSNERMVFGRVRPPPMKISGGLAIERQDSTNNRSRLQLPLKKQPTSDSDGTGADLAEANRAPSPSAALRAAKKEASTRQVAGGGESAQVSGSHRPSVCGQLNRSSTKKLLNLIKTKTKSDLTLPDGDENDEIEALLGALEHESVDNIDWDELGLDEDEVKGIIGAGRMNEDDDDDVKLSSSSSSSSSSCDEDEEVEVEEDEETELDTTTKHYVFRSR